MASVKTGVKWAPVEGQGRRWATDDPRFDGCVLAEKWVSCTFGPYVIQAENGDGQVLGYGLSKEAATYYALFHSQEWAARMAAHVAAITSESLPVRLGPSRRAFSVPVRAASSSIPLLTR